MNKKTFFRTIKINVESFILLLTTIHNCLCLRRKKNIGFENHKWEQENKNLKIETGKKKIDKRQYRKVGKVFDFFGRTKNWIRI